MRLLLIEFFPTALRYGENTMHFPFLKGLARDRGFETLWLCFGGGLAPASGKPSGRASQARLRPADLRVLSMHLERFRPSHVVTSDILCPEAGTLLSARTPPPKLLVMPMLQEAARGAPPGTEMGRHLALVSSDPRRRDYFGRCAWFLDWLGVADQALARRYLIAGARPDYAALLANPQARDAAQQITIVSGRLCGNRRTLARNPCFRGLGARAVREHRGCSFCRSPATPSLTPPGGDMLAILESQLRGVLETAGPAGRDKRLFEFYDFQAIRRFDEVFALVLRLKVPPSVFLFNPRLDEVLRARRRIRRTLPALARAGHEVRCLSMGIENFSERENARFNKGISLAQVDEFLALTKEWEALYPGVFRPFKAGHEKVELGLILFTPWTTLADLRLNLTRARERGFPEQGDWLYSTLHVHSNVPIYQLARRERGILVRRWPDRGMGYGFYKNQGEAGPAVPWRFQSPRVADFFALVVRFCAADREGAACAFFRGDREFRRVSRLCAKARVTPLAFAQALLETLESAQPDHGRGVVLHQALALARGPVRESLQATTRPARLEAKVVAWVLDRLKERRPEAFSSLDLQRVEDVPGPGPGGIRLTFSSAGRKVVVDLLEGASREPGFLNSRFFRAVYLKEAPVTSAQQRQQLAALLRLVDAGVARAQASRSASTRRATSFGERNDGHSSEDE